MKKTLSIILAVCVVLSLAVISVSAKTYTDVPDTHWAKAPIDKWTTNNVMVGKTDTVFGVNDYMTRGEIAEILNNLLRKSNVSLTVLSKFSDVDTTTPYAQAIANCSEYGIFTGYSDGTFRPTENVSREQLISTIGRAIDLTSNGNEASRYNDKATISEYALPFVNGLTKDGRLIGYPDGSVKPARFISKAETAKLLFNIVDVYVTSPGSYNVTPGQIVFVATEGNVNFTGGQPESVVVSQQSAVTVPEGTKVVNKANGTVTVNNNNVTQQTSIIAPAPADTGTTVSGGTSSGGGGYKPSSYKATFEVKGDVKGGGKATETSSPVTVSTTAKITNTILT
ncbi:MAG: S-layer homology domain-containing protein, partial [Clostridia bacterium]|nr:S-layer homology domain-containing protein [Clostridia bacterium]